MQKIKNIWHHSNLTGNERSWSNWSWLKPNVTHLLIVFSVTHLRSRSRKYIATCTLTCTCTQVHKNRPLCSASPYTDANQSDKRWQMGWHLLNNGTRAGKRIGSLQSFHVRFPLRDNVVPRDNTQLCLSNISLLLNRKDERIVSWNL